MVVCAVYVVCYILEHCWIEARKDRNQCFMKPVIPVIFFKAQEVLADDGECTIHGTISSVRLEIRELSICEIRRQLDTCFAYWVKLVRRAIVRREC